MKQAAEQGKQNAKQGKQIAEQGKQNAEEGEQIAELHQQIAERDKRIDACQARERQLMEIIQSMQAKKGPLCEREKRLQKREENFHEYGGEQTSQGVRLCSVNTCIYEIAFLLLLLWYILRGLSSSKGLIGGLSSVVQKKQDNRKERKTKRKKKVKKKEKKKLEGEPEEEKSKQTRRRKDRCTSSGLKVKDLEKIYLLCRKSEEKTWRKKHCDSEIWQRPEECSRDG